MGMEQVPAKALFLLDLSEEHKLNSSSSLSAELSTPGVLDGHSPG